MSKSSSILLRLAAALVLIAATTLIPWWATMVLVASYGLVFRLFFEGVLIGWLIDASFATEVPWVSIAILVYIVVVEGVVYYISH